MNFLVPSAYEMHPETRALQPKWSAKYYVFWCSRMAIKCPLNHWPSQNASWWPSAQQVCSALWRRVPGFWGERKQSAALEIGLGKGREGILGNGLETRWAFDVRVHSGIQEGRISCTCTNFNYLRKSVQKVIALFDLNLLYFLHTWIFQYNSERNLGKNIWKSLEPSGHQHCTTDTFHPRCNGIPTWRLFASLTFFSFKDNFNSWVLVGTGSRSSEMLREILNSYCKNPAFSFKGFGLEKVWTRASQAFHLRFALFENASILESIPSSHKSREAEKGSIYFRYK